MKSILILMIFLIFWIIWFVLADKKRWKEILPTSIFAALLGSTADTISTHYPLIWKYTQPPWIELVNNYSIYIVVTYLFIQFIPKKETLRNMFLYLLVWTSIALAIETLYIKTGLMEYRGWWEIEISYIADWLLYILFYYHHKIWKN